MKPNTLVIGLLKDGERAGALAKLHTYTGANVTVGAHIGAGLWDTLGVILKEVEPVGARYCMIFGTEPMDFKRMDYPRLDTRWVRKFEKDRAPKWVLEFKAPAFEVDHVKFVVLRQLFRFPAWRYTQVSSLPGTRKLLDEGYTEEYTP